jgi:hypothetical protein
MVSSCWSCTLTYSRLQENNLLALGSRWAIVNHSNAGGGRLVQYFLQVGGRQITVAKGKRWKTNSCSGLEVESLQILTAGGEKVTVIKVRGKRWTK